MLISIPFGSINRQPPIHSELVKQLFQFLLVRLIEVGGFESFGYLPFQFLLVRLIDNPFEPVAGGNEFQFLLVRLIAFREEKAWLEEKNFNSFWFD